MDSIFYVCFLHCVLVSPYTPYNKCQSFIVLYNRQRFTYGCCATTLSYIYCLPDIRESLISFPMAFCVKGSRSSLDCLLTLKHLKYQEQNNTNGSNVVSLRLTIFTVFFSPITLGFCIQTLAKSLIPLIRQEGK